MKNLRITVNGTVYDVQVEEVDGSAAPAPVPAAAPAAKPAAVSKPAATAGGEGLALLLETHIHSGMPIDDRYYMYLVNIQMDVWEQTGKQPMLPLRHIRTSNLFGKLKIKAIFLKILGIKNLCKINKLIHTFKKPSRW